tara:strand:- start:1263 stop:2090 length:828 start_codon:yes stop_codon:yes gene_type:complete
MKSERTLIAGPWVGEFGWELFAWQAYMRSLSRYFGKTIIISRPNSKSLYEDFADDFIGFKPPMAKADSYFLQNIDTTALLKQVIKENEIPLDGNTTLFLPRRIGVPPHTHYDEIINFGTYAVKPEYIKFGKKKNIDYDYVFHIRERQLRKEDNWEPDRWLELKTMLGTNKIACVGTKVESGHIKDTEDLRDISLGELFDILHNAKCIFGPSSGPIHLSSLCGCPHVVWGDQSKSLNRHYTNWNPLQTKALFLGDYLYHPTAKHVYDKFKDWSKNG